MQDLGIIGHHPVDILLSVCKHANAHIHTHTHARTHSDDTIHGYKIAAN